MPKNTLLDTSTVNMFELLGNGRIYRVPPFQRDYSWREDNWDDLWTDILAVMSAEEDRHYMGTVVLQVKPDGKEFAVIDGQQRMATLSLIAIAVIERLEMLVKAGVEPAENTERATILRRTFLGDKDPKSLLYSSKLFLNSNNDGFYQGNLLQLRPPTVPHRLSDTDKLLWRAFQYFQSKLADLTEVIGDGSKLTGFLTDTVAAKLLFIQIQVQDELSAYTVFETLNARGVELTSTDLLKNYLFSLIPSSDIGHVQALWQRIANIVGTDKLPEFLRHYLNSKQSLVRSERLFHSVKTAVKTGPAALALLDQLEQEADSYSAIFDPSHDAWKTDKVARFQVRVLRELRVRQVAPLLLASRRTFAAKDFARILKLAVVLSVRFNLIGNANTNELERVYNEAALKIVTGSAHTVEDVIASLQPVYVPDDKFHRDFASASINVARRKKVVRYLLYSLEEHAGGGHRDFEEDPGTIEHILPQNPSVDWLEEFPPETHETYVHRLGNLALLEPDLNNEVAGNKAFERKRPIYAKSSYIVTRALQSAEWTRNALTDRQDVMADRAVEIWNVDQV